MGSRVPFRFYVSQTNTEMKRSGIEVAFVLFGGRVNEYRDKAKRNRGGVRAIRGKSKRTPRNAKHLEVAFAVPTIDTFLFHLLSYTCKYIFCIYLFFFRSIAELFQTSKTKSVSQDLKTPGMAEGFSSFLFSNSPWLFREKAIQ